MTQLQTVATARLKKHAHCKTNARLETLYTRQLSQQATEASQNTTLA